MLGIIEQCVKITKDLLKYVDRYHTMVILKFKKSKNRAITKTKPVVVRKSGTKKNSLWKEKEQSVRLGENGEMDLYGPGSIHQLTARLLVLDKNYYKVFLFACSIFLNSEDVWSKLQECYAIPEDINEAEQTKFHILEILDEWAKQEGHSNVATILSDIENFAKEVLLSKDDKFQPIITNVLRDIQKSKKKRYSIEHSGCPIYFPMYCTVGYFPYRMICLFTAEDISKQLTLIDSELYKSIQCRELLAKRWQREITAIHSPNVCALINRCENLSLWVATSILVQEPENRVEVLSKFIDIAQCLFDLANFHSLMGIIIALNMSAVSRLQAFSGLSRKALERYRQLNHICNLNFKTLRETMDVRQTIIPYIGVYLSDIIHIEEGVPEHIVMENGMKLINFIKHKKIYDRVVSLLEPQSRSLVGVERLEPLYTYLYILPTVLNNRELHMLSIEEELSASPVQTGNYE